MRRTGLHAMITLPAFPDVHLSDVVVADSRVGVVVREVEGVHIVAQLCKYILQQQGEVTRLDQSGDNITSYHMRTIALLATR